uniref:CRAL-TRIO domain-containing protein n=1 Tax=Glossina austeni TaxID=7395 RepID=A0A1A9VDF5_GLOAU
MSKHTLHMTFSIVLSIKVSEQRLNRLQGLSWIFLFELMDSQNLTYYKTEMETRELGFQLKEKDKCIGLEILVVGCVLNMLQIRLLNDDLQRKAREELNEVPERIHEDLQALKTWIEEQPHLCANTDDQFLISFLRGCKYSLEKAKKKIDSYYSFKTKFPEFCNVTNVDSARMREIFRSGAFLYLPIPLRNNGPRICWVRLASADMYSLEEVLAVNHVLQDILMLEDDNAVINGLVMIADHKEISLSHILQTTPTYLKKWIAYNHESIPLRLKSIHFLNAPKIFDVVYNTAKPMLPLKQQDRFLNHNSLDSLSQHVPLKYLPKDYGGENGSIKEIIAEWDKKLNKYRDYFDKSTQWGIDEKLRFDETNPYNDRFGSEGSFRKLEVD